MELDLGGELLRGLRQDIPQSSCSRQNGPQRPRPTTEMLVSEPHTCLAPFVRSQSFVQQHALSDFQRLCAAVSWKLA